MKAVIHFKMPAENKTRMSEFYTEVFGWKTRLLGLEMNEYIVVTTTDTDAKGRSKIAGTFSPYF
jgi:predicted enzyme related to lactoylglutathione lyase